MDAFWNRIILIAGNGRNSGKTTLACRLISRFSHTVPLVAIKISPHQYHYPEESISPFKTFSIAEETDSRPEKDSSKMLAAGARRSFFITSPDERLREAFMNVLQLSPENAFFICESGGLGHVIDPALFIIVNRSDKTDIKPGTQILMDKPHLWVTFDGEEFDFNLKRISIFDKKWVVKDDVV
jgi:hypothetical protein